MILRPYICFPCFRCLFQILPSSFHIMSFLFPFSFIPSLFSFSFFPFLHSILYSQFFSCSFFLYPHHFSSLLLSHLLCFIFIFHYISRSFICILYSFLHFRHIFPFHLPSLSLIEFLLHSFFSSPLS